MASPLKEGWGKGLLGDSWGEGKKGDQGKRRFTETVQVLDLWLTTKRKEKGMEVCAAGLAELIVKGCSK